MFKVARAILVAMAMALATTLQFVFEAGKWVLKSVRNQFAPPVGAGAGIEAALEDGSAVGSQIATAAQAPRPEAANDLGFELKLLPEAPYDAFKDYGAIAKAYIRSRVCAQAEPDLSALDETTEAWLRGLTLAECQRLATTPPRRLASHIFGDHLFRNLAPCHVRDPAMPALLLADTDAPDDRHREILDDLADDPDLVPGHQAPWASRAA
ncbi:hypothetical protein ASF60_18115 [Methylobacterium sp. Leaf113]|uniref:hypothetical protein n=1 Tax=Methylobacterium sp. Leaf113 TaxID=1736259 RepID=UPI0006F341D4|nr:hypothetical protein [Methylobacterium sp. Leaf113]KQP91359.1 hypothetical protein ASF60_18115 [Methylobacterium sp. Leaf113]